MNMKMKMGNGYENGNQITGKEMEMGMKMIIGLRMENKK